MSAFNRTINRSNRMSFLSKVASTAVSTAAAYILIPVAIHYAVGIFTEVLVLATVVLWTLVLTRMWGELITLTAHKLANPAPAVTDLAAMLRVLPILDSEVNAAV